MKQRSRALLTGMALLVMFLVGFAAGHWTPAANALPTFQGETGSNAYLERFEEIWNLVHLEYYARPLDDEALVRGAINGMMEALGDPHTSYMPPEEFTLFNDDLSGSYTGIGATVEAEGDRLLIVSPFDGSPAEAAGLLPGDEILRVDETPVSDFEDPLSAITLVRGPEGEPVVLRIKRGSETFDVTIVRATIPLVSASGEMLEEGVGYLRLADFGATTVEQLRQSLEEILAQEPAGLVLDLRGNPGGSLDTALRVVSEFIGEGIIMQQQSGDGTRQTFEAYPGGLATDPALPLVVLVDGGSASASEIVAGAIRDRGRGQLVGQTTYGKGTVQNWHDLGADKGGVRVTIARWLTPNGTWIHEQGIVPDVLIAAGDPEAESEEDIQLETAVNLLLGRPLPSASVQLSPGFIDAPHWRVPMAQ